MFQVEAWLNGAHQFNYDSPGCLIKGKPSPLRGFSPAQKYLGILATRRRKNRRKKEMTAFLCLFFLRLYLCLFVAIHQILRTLTASFNALRNIRVRTRPLASVPGKNVT
jgi:hypothetical protein